MEVFQVGMDMYIVVDGEETVADFDNVDDALAFVRRGGELPPPGVGRRQVRRG